VKRYLSDRLLHNGHPAVQNEPQGGIVEPTQLRDFHYNVELGEDEVAEGDSFGLGHLDAAIAAIRCKKQSRCQMLP